MKENPEIAAETVPPLAAGLYLVGTPIGNLEDITLRALRILRSVEVLACEDTRVTRKLFQYYQIPPAKTLVALNDHNEKAAAKHLVNFIKQGKSVAYCSDAGMPGISDPGFNLWKTATEAGVFCDIIPGVSALTTAIPYSGLPAGHFTFFGFPPRRDGRLQRIFTDYRDLDASLVFYESPRRLGRLLRIAAANLGENREAAVCLELSKKFQRVKKGTLRELGGFFSENETKGEAVVIIAGSAGEKEDSGLDTEDSV